MWINRRRKKSVHTYTPPTTTAEAQRLEDIVIIFNSAFSFIPLSVFFSYVVEEILPLCASLLSVGNTANGSHSIPPVCD